MDTTRASLLIRIKDPNDSVSWSEFHQLYAPILYRYARARGLTHADAEEIQSSCYETIVSKIPEFDYAAEKGGFKAWLHRIVINRVIDLKRKGGAQRIETEELGRISDDDKTPDEIFDEHWKLAHLKYCLEQVRGMVHSKTFQAFELLANDTSVEDVCKQLELNVNQVYKAKSRVLKLVRQQMEFMYPHES